jgi:hypothetical protein
MGTWPVGVIGVIIVPAFFPIFAAHVKAVPYINATTFRHHVSGAGAALGCHLNTSSARRRDLRRKLVKSGLQKSDDRSFFGNAIKMP